MSEELKPCPFCNGVANIERYGNARQSMQIACSECGCSLETSETFLGENCQWNTRQPDNEFVKQIDGFWEGLWNRYDMESREEVEKDTRESWAKGTSPLNVALHYIWKREPKVNELVEALETIAYDMSHAEVFGGCNCNYNECHCDQDIAKQAIAKYKENKE